MWRSKYRERAEAAISHYRFHAYGIKEDGTLIRRGIATVADLLNALEKRATTEKRIAPILLAIDRLLSPPDCRMYHCLAHTAYAWCSCARGRVPGKCPEHRAYLKRKRDREAAAKSKSPLTEEK